MNEEFEKMMAEADMSENERLIFRVIHTKAQTEALQEAIERLEKNGFNEDPHSDYDCGVSTCINILEAMLKEMKGE